MREHIVRWAVAARRQMAPFGVIITGARWFVPRLPQRNASEIYACLDGTTLNADFFGTPFENWRRIRLLAEAYGAWYSLDPAPPVAKPALDMRLSLAPVGTVTEVPPFRNEPPEHGTVDATEDHTVRLVPLADALRDGNVQPGTSMDVYCRRYGVDHVLTHGRHFISPDVTSVELLEDLLNTWRVQSVLEIGAGVGVCGMAALRRGIEDYTFVDIVPEVCSYVHRLTGYRAECADAMSFALDRHWDLISIGLPYEVNPGFLRRRGRELAQACSIVTFQSGCRNFFDFEHDWLMYRPDLHRWPWFDPEQTIAAHFPHVAELAVDWQLAAVGSNDEAMYRALLRQQSDDRLIWDTEHICL